MSGVVRLGVSRGCPRRFCLPGELHPLLCPRMYFHRLYETHLPVITHPLRALPISKALSQWHMSQRSQRC